MIRTILIFIFIFWIFILPVWVNAQVSQPLKQRVDADSTRLVTIFKDIHQNPELAFQEKRTSALVAAELRRLNYAVLTGIAKTGVVGILKNGPGPVVMYRADMDCNPVKEVTGLTWASKKMVKAADGTAVPVMHACGHDAHITWLLGAAKVMADIKNQWKGTLVLVAQPAEEIGEGAKAMVKDPLFMQRVPVPDFVFGMHSWPTAVGTIVNKPGESMSGVDFLDIEFLGLGGHGALPETTKDPVVMVCTAVLQYQTIISRQVAAQDVAVLTVGSIHAGNGNNVIPAQATARLSLRWFNEKTRQTILDGIIRINEGLAVAYGLPVEKKPLITMKAHIAPVINEPRLATSMNEWLSGKMPAEKIIADGAPIMMAEDFTYLVRDTTKSVYDFMLIGIASPVEVEAALNEGKVSPFSNHSGNFKVDLAAIPHGVEVASNALLGFFNGKFTGGK